MTKVLSHHSFLIARAMAIDILSHPLDHKWTLQGLGMLRCSLPDGVRLHVWTPQLAWVKDAILHDHPWSFESGIISGSIINTRFVEQERDELHTETWEGMTIKCGAGGCAMSEKKVYHLLRMPPEVYTAGDIYTQAANEIHLSQPSDGAVSIIRRLDDTEQARVFWPVGKSWDSAEPRTPYEDEIEMACGFALAGFK